MATGCNQNTDPLKLVREGTSQDQRSSPSLAPAYAPVNERTPAHEMVFAQAYSAFLRYYDSNNVEVDDWKRFFREDVSVHLAIAAVQDIEYYKSNIKAALNFLNDLENKLKAAGLKNNLGYLFSYAGVLAKQLDALKESLPVKIPLKGALQNLITSQLAPAFKRLIAYYKGDFCLTPPHRLIADTHPGIVILGGTTVPFSEIYGNGLSQDWITDSAANWNAYTARIAEDSSVYGTGSGVFVRINHIATHNLFTSIFDQFLKVYARIVGDAKKALAETFTKWDRHEPHYALFLAYLRLFEYARAETNTLTGRHLDFYYREILQLKEKTAEPGHAHLLVELAKHVDTHLLKTGDLFKAGKDDKGIEAFFANDRDLVANQAKVTALKKVYRHGNKPVGTQANKDKQAGRLYASPVANSDDGLGGELTSTDQSWHPFYNKIYKDGTLAEIKMPEAEIGFAIASHYLLMAEGTRTVTVKFKYVNGTLNISADDIVCFLTSEKGWMEIPQKTINNSQELIISLSGADPAVTVYSAKVHEYDFSTNLPILLVKLRHRSEPEYPYSKLQDVAINGVDITVSVEGLKTLAVSNDFGPVDTSKPFQPYGASPVAANSLIIGSKEIFQKTLTTASVNVTWLVSPSPYTTAPMVDLDFLNEGKWVPSFLTPIAVDSFSYPLTKELSSLVVDAPDLSPNEFYNTASRHGFVRLRLGHHFGQNEYQKALISHLRKDTVLNSSPIAFVPYPEPPPIGPSMSALSMSYTASQPVALNPTAVFKQRQARFFHLAPFGQSEQHPFLNSEGKVYLLPQFDFQRDVTKESEAELYIGLTGLKLSQNLALLFQVIDGTADPLSVKPDPHIHWSYLRGNEWIAFAKNEVEDHTGGLLNSGIVTFAMPRDASDTNTILPAGMHWIRAAVARESDAVCRLQMVVAQALEVTFKDKGNDPAFPAKLLPAGTISKLDQPDAAVKKITQPFATFGGRGAELPTAFYTRISERLRHKDRAIALWDYERLILEAFPQIYKAKCLNHTQYEPTESPTGIYTGIYKELAPGHVTIVTIPNQQSQNLRDPLRPYTSLGLLEEIAQFLRKRLSCFVSLHVTNPQFEEVQVSCKVRLHDGADEAFYENKLREAITRFLSPWAFPGGGSPSFGGKIYKSVLINFVEEQPYVDYVTDFKLFHMFIDGDGGKQTVERNEVEGSKAVSILVSVPAPKHSITVIKPAEEETPGENCPCEA